MNYNYCIKSNGFTITSVYFDYFEYDSESNFYVFTLKGIVVSCLRCEHVDFILNNNYKFSNLFDVTIKEVV